jgi:hypothetical protein
MNKEIVIKGQLLWASNGEYNRLLGVVNDCVEAKPLAEVLYYKGLNNKFLTVRYWISDKPGDEEDLKEDYLQCLYGKTESEYGARYSDYTGYLWTDEDFIVGGHDIITELKSYIGKYLYLVVQKGDKQ